jgi:DNA-binding transcriptional MocR family regulator
MDAVERVLREHLRTGDRVALEDPSFPGLLDLVSGSGYLTAPVGVDQEGPLPDSLEAALSRRCSAFILTPRAQNPTGAAVTPGRAAELSRVLKRHPGVLLIENDYAGPVAGAPMHTLSTGSRRPWVVVRSTSKFLGPDLRIAVIAGDDLTIGRLITRQALGPRWVSGVLQELAVTLWSDPASGRRLARAADIYAQRRTAALEAMRATGIAAVSSSGFNVWVPVREEVSVVLYVAECGWAVAAGERFRIHARPGIRITTSTLQPPDAARLATDLAAALGVSPAGTA